MKFFVRQLIRKHKVLVILLPFGMLLIPVLAESLDRRLARRVHEH